jgi:hypothetical protein
MADLRSDLVPEERAAVDAILSRAQVDASTVVGQRALLDFSWRGATSYARRRLGPDVEDAVDRRTRDMRSTIAVEGGHVVAARLAGTRLDDLRLFAPLTHLVVLDVHDAALERIEGLDGLGQLDHLDLSGNRLARIEGLEGLAALRSLYLADDHLVRIEGLDRLTSLEVLDLGGNGIEHVDGLDGLGRLEAVSLERNPIARIEGLDGLPELIDLDMSWCRIESLQSLGSLPKLRYLNLWHNRIRSLAGIEDATPALLYLGLGENPYAFDDPENIRLRDRYGEGRLVAFF